MMNSAGSSPTFQVSCTNSDLSIAAHVYHSDTDELRQGIFILVGGWVFLPGFFFLSFWNQVNRKYLLRRIFV